MKTGNRSEEVNINNVILSNATTNSSPLIVEESGLSATSKTAIIVVVLIVILIAIGASLGVLYYFKVYKKRLQQQLGDSTTLSA